MPRAFESQVGVEDAVGDIRFEGFRKPEELLWKQWFVNVSRASRLPMPKLDSITYERSDRVIDHVLPRVGYSPDTNAAVRRQQDGSFKMTFQKRLPPFHSEKSKDLKEKDRVRGTFIHEIAHLNSPYDRAKDKNLSEEERETAKREAAFVDAVVKQCLTTGIFLNQYHLQLQDELVGGVLSWMEAMTDMPPLPLSRFREETWAILVQMRYSEPDKLRDIEERQKRKLKKRPLDLTTPLHRSLKNNPHEFAQIFTPEGESKPKGVDTILCRLTKAEDAIELTAVIDKVSKS